MMIHFFHKYYFTSDAGNLIFDTGEDALETLFTSLSRGKAGVQRMINRLLNGILGGINDAHEEKMDTFQEVVGTY